MLRYLAFLTILGVLVAGDYQLMIWDTPWVFLSAFGAVLCCLAGGLVWGWRGSVTGFAIGLIAPLAYLVLWFVFDLPSHGDFDL